MLAKWGINTPLVISYKMNILYVKRYEQNVRGWLCIKIAGAVVYLLLTPTALKTLDFQEEGFARLCLE